MSEGAEDGAGVSPVRRGGAIFQARGTASGCLEARGTHARRGAVWPRGQRGEEMLAESDRVTPRISMFKKWLQNRLMGIYIKTYTPFFHVIPSIWLIFSLVSPAFYLFQSEGTGLSRIRCVSLILGVLHRL